MAGSMDDLLEALGGKNETEVIRLMKSYVTILDRRTLADLDPLLAISPNHSSIAFLFILIARFKLSTSDLLQSTIVFANNFDCTQIKYVRQEFYSFGEIVFNSDCDDRSKVLILSNLASRWGTNSAFTIFHRLAIQTSLKSLLLTEALILLDQKIEIYDSQLYGTSAQDFLLYHYYGGMIYLAAKQTLAAYSFFKKCLVCPGTQVSMIQLEANKKFILVSLLRHDTSLNFPNTNVVGLRKEISNKSEVYTSLIQPYLAFDFVKMKSLIEDNEEEFKSDGNWGLVKQIINHMVTLFVQQLNQTFMSCSLMYIEETAGPIALSFIAPLNFQQKIIKMMSDKSVHCFIDSNRIVHFQDDPTAFNTCESVAILTTQVSKMVAVNDNVLSLDRQISLSQNYLQQQKKLSLA